MQSHPDCRFWSVMIFTAERYLRCGVEHGTILDGYHGTMNLGREVETLRDLRRCTPGPLLRLHESSMTKHNYQSHTGCLCLQAGMSL